MSYLGSKPANSPLTSELIPNSIITNAKINDVAATKLTGQVPDANAPSGSVIQVIQTVKTDTYSQTAASWTDITGLSVSITPSSTSNKILVMADISVSQDGSYGWTYQYMRVMRDSTAIGIPSAAGSRLSATGQATSDQYQMQTTPLSYLDSPSTTSAITYKIQFYNQQTARISYINRSGVDTDNANYARAVSTITVMEIAG